MTMTTPRDRPPAPAHGAEVPAFLRRALLDIFKSKMSVPATQLGKEFRQKIGVGAWADFVDVLSGWFGAEAAERFRLALLDFIERNKGRRGVVAGTDYAAGPAMCALPTPLFLDAVEVAFAVSRSKTHYVNTADTSDINKARHQIDALFALHGVQFGFEGDRVVWRGDADTLELTVRPALAAVSDSRLASARSEFEGALAELRRGTDKELRDACVEAGRAVESAMKVVLRERGGTFSPSDSAEALWNALRTEGLVDKETKNALLAAPQLRNPPAHGSGTDGAAVVRHYAETAVRASATALIYLSTLLDP